MNVCTHPARALARTGAVARSSAPAHALARLARTALAAAALLLLPAIAAAQTLTIGNAATAEAATTLAPGAYAVPLDAFTLTASTGTATVTSLTVAMPVGSAALVGQLTIQNVSTCSMATPFATATNPATDTVTLATTGLTVASGAARAHWVCMKPRTHAGMPPVPGNAVAVTGRVTGAVAAGYTVGATADVASAARTIDNLSPGPVTGLNGAAGVGQVSLAWTNPADADFREVVILQKTSAITDAPVEGVTYQPFTFNGTEYLPTLIGTSTVAYVGSASLVAITGLTAGTSYYFKVFAKDANGNYASTGPQVGPLVPTVTPIVTTISGGTESANASLAPGGAITNLDAFTLVTSTGTDTVTAATVSLLPTSAFSVVGTVQITNNAGTTVYGTVTDPTSNTVAFTGLNIPVTTTPTQYRVRIQPKTHAAMPAVPGNSYAVTGLVTAFTCTNSKTGTDAGSSTVTIDNLSPANPAWGAVTPGNTQVVLNWTNPTGDFARVAIFRSAAPVTDAPTEGAVPAGTVGSSTVIFSGAATTYTNTGLTNGNPYYFKIFAQDTSGNWSVGSSVGPLIPGSGAASVGSTIPDTLLPVVQVVNPVAGSRVATTFKVQVRAWSPVAAITGVAVRVNLGAPTALTKNTKYGSATTSGVWEGNLTLAAGTFTLDAQATSSVGTVTSNSLQVTVSASRGDGNLLVRDNAAQLCTDCHALPTHSSESTGSTYGSWSTSCRDCHTPHGTKNVFLVGDQITPPPRGAAVTTPKSVAFSSTSGVAGGDATANRAAASYVNTDNTGPCQVCHTLTLYYRNDGTSPGGANHQTGQRCTSCHQHQSGMAVNCTGCHGTAGRVGIAGADPRLPAAPPVAATSSPAAVGAHLAHLNQVNLRGAPLACTDCHPANNAHQGTVDIAFSALASGITASVPLTPSYDFTGNTCSSTWCHSVGGTAGGSNLAPNWTGTSAQVSCGTCHGAPPPAPHPANPNCNVCHAGYATTGLTAAARATHIDGTLQVPPPGSCTSCHGDAARTPVAGLAGTDPNIAVAPPMDTTGSLAVDAHMAHINKQSVPVQCTDCHGTLPAVGDPSHPSGTVDVTMVGSALANQNGGFAAYSAGSCSSVYCHGASFPTEAKGSNTLPSWTDTVTCGSCHGAPPGDGLHRSVTALTDCIRCHNQTVDAAGGIVIAAGLHVNGTVETNVMDNGCESCHGTAGRVSANGSAAPFFEAAPPTSLAGGSATTVVGVGVHLAHVNGTRSRNVDCEECHLGSTAFEAFSPNPATMWLHADGRTDLAFGPLASAGGASPTYAAGSGAGCAATYCHGNFAGGAGAGNLTPNWTTAGTLACTACHANPPALPHPQNTNCSGCHGAGYSTTTVAQLSHVDGMTTGTSFGCTSCHGAVGTPSPGATSGTPTLAAPGVSGGLAVTTSAAPSPTVVQYGAHAAHLTQTGFTATAVACTDCHAVPPDGNTTHGSGTGGTGGAAATVTFSLLAQGNVPLWSPPGSVTSAKGTGASTAGAAAAASAAAGGPGTTDAWSTPATPSYSRTGSVGCTAVYCHGEFRNGQLGKTLVWAQDITLNCNSCHGTPGANPATPPTGTHPANSSCGTCHTGYTGTSVNPATHINGALEVVAQTCSGCHGDAARVNVATATALDSQGANLVKASPPVDSTGGAASTQVGAHLSHVNQGATAPALSNALACTNCHVVPTVTTHSDGTPQVTFGSIATSRGAVPTAFNATTHNCASTYCHGNFPTYGLGANTINWGASSPGTKLTCTQCHVNPATTPTYPHPANNGCATCHGAGYSTTTVAAATHVNGTTTQVTYGCSQCHGVLSTASPGVTAAAPNNSAPGAAGTGVNTTGAAIAATTPAYGAHRAHLEQSGTYRAAAIACADCHTVPAAGDRSHATGVGTGGAKATLTWSALARGTVDTWSSGTPASPSYTTAAGCASTYCHGQFKNGQTGKTVVWAQDITLTCNSCHGTAGANPATPPGGTHPANSSCGTCHSGYTGTTANTAVHMNGLLEVAAQTCSGCHGDAARVNVATATALDSQGANLVKASPPVDSTSGTTSTQVGAHLSHVNQGATAPALSNALACTNCHVVPTSTAHASGTPEVTFGSLATSRGAVPLAFNATTHNCASTYCHGNFPTYGLGANTINWGTTSPGTKRTCTQCHVNPATTPTYPHPANTGCATCHGAGYTATTVAAATHVNGTTNQVTYGCSQCHGVLSTASPGVTAAAPNNSAPGAAGTGVNTTGAAIAATTPAYGAHRAHLEQTGFKSTAITCADCHTVPAAGDKAHATGAGTGGARATLTWSALARGTVNAWTAAATPTYTTAAGCASTYCHGQFTNGQTGKTVAWAQDITLTCNSCHGTAGANPATPPGGTHPANSSCGTCHTGYTGTTVNASVHLNGSLDVVTLTCFSCHGTSGVNEAPPLATNGTSTGVKVGAHQKHVTATTLRSAALTCNACHTVPASTSHANSTVNMTWNALATTGGLTPTPGNLTGAALTTWEATPTCTNYCHGQKWAANAQYRGSITAPNWTGGVSQQACGTCHLVAPTSSAHSGVTSTTNCSGCHTGYNCTSGNLAACTVNKTVHINGTLESSADCIACHNGVQGSRRNVVAEFNNTWSHKRSAGGAVTKYDCAVCHMEGDTTTGNTTAVHQDGVINLRDPDTGANIKGVTFAGTPGAYTSTAADATFASFSRNLSVRLEADPQFLTLGAIMTNQCLKCHDANGANSALARVPGGVAGKPFNTTISGTGYVGGTGQTACAAGTDGCVTNVARSFATTNSSYHPVAGKQNNWYAKLTRMKAPWNVTGRGASVNTTSYGDLISCWDCHAPTGTASTVTLTSTVTAHGGASTVRNSPTATGTAPTAATGSTLCAMCHNLYDTCGGATTSTCTSTTSHGANSAFSSNPGRSAKSVYLNYGCNKCHSSSYTTAVVRPIRGEDVHGFDRLPGTGTDAMWPTGATETRKPYAFIRNTQMFSNHQPARIGATTTTPTCVHLNDGPCTSRTETYTVGGTY